MTSTQSPEAHELLEYLKTKMEIPENVVGFKLCLYFDDVVRITDMEYHPKLKGKDDGEGA